MKTLILAACLLAALPLYSQEPPKAKAQTPQRMVGKWDANYIGGSIGTWDFKADGALEIHNGSAGPAIACRWEKVKTAIVVTYPDGAKTEIEWPIKGGKTQGHDARGKKLWLTEAK